MARKIIKIGKSLGITIPKEILEKMKLGAGDAISIEYDDDRSSLVMTQQDALSPRQNKVAELTHKFIERYRDDLEELAKK